MRLRATQPGMSVDDVVAGTGFESTIPDEMGQNEPPSEEELRILLGEVDWEEL